MKILFLCGREIQYPRNAIIAKALQEIGETDLITSESKTHSIILRSFLVVIKSIPYLLKNKYDVIFIGFYGYIIFLILTQLCKVPIIFDAFISNYDTLVLDRHICKDGSVLAKFIRHIDAYCYRRADFLLFDTQSNVEYITTLFGISGDKIDFVPVGAPEALFIPSDQPSPEHDYTQVLFYCTYLPLHGADIVIKAAAALDSASYQFLLVGNGPEFEKTRQLALELSLSNVKFLPPVPIEMLPGLISEADICLAGHFGPSEKAQKTIPGKIYQLMAMGKPIIAGDTQANREILTHEKNALLCPPGDFEKLAALIKNLAEDREERLQIALQARSDFVHNFSEKKITEKINLIIDKVVGV